MLTVMFCVDIAGFTMLLMRR